MGTGVCDDNWDLIAPHTLILTHMQTQHKHSLMCIFNLCWIYRHGSTQRLWLSCDYPDRCALYSHILREGG